MPRVHIKESPPAPGQLPDARPPPEPGGAHRVWIEHAAERYLLQMTRSGKLILTK